MDSNERGGKRGEPRRRRRSKPVYLVHAKERGKNANKDRRIERVGEKEAPSHPREKLTNYLRYVGQILRKFPWER